MSRPARLRAHAHHALAPVLVGEQADEAPWRALEADRAFKSRFRSTPEYERYVETPEADQFFRWISLKLGSLRISPCLNGIWTQP